MTLSNNLEARVKTLSDSQGVLSASSSSSFPSTTMLVRGKWIVAQNKVGIIANILPDNFVEVHFVNAIGITVGSLPVPASEVRLALYDEIPEARRHRTRNEFAALGYF